MTVVLSSTFTASNGTKVSTLGFTNTNGDPEVFNNRARSQDYGTFQRTVFSTANPVANHTARATFRLVGTMDGSETAGLLGRYDTGSAGYQVVLFRTKIELQKIVDGSVLGSAYSWSPATNTDYLVELAMNGTSLSVWLDGTQVIGPVTNSATTAANKTGLVWSQPFAVDHSTVGWHIDNPQVDDAFPTSASPSLAITTQPATTASGYVMSPSPVVRKTTDGTTTDTGFTGNITAALVGSGGVLLGTTTVASTSGVATFSALRPCIAGTYQIRFSSSGVSDLDSSSFTVTTAGGGGVILGGSMQRALKDGETTAARKRLFFDIRDSAGAPWAGSVTGVKAKLSLSGAAAADSTADIVRVAGASHYVQLSDVEAAAGDAGDILESWVPAASGRLESTHAYAEVFADDPYAAAASVSAIQSGLATAASVAALPTVTAIRNAILSWELWSGFSLAKLFRDTGAIWRGLSGGQDTAAPTFSAADGTYSVSATMSTDAQGNFVNRTSVTSTSSGTP